MKMNDFIIVNKSDKKEAGEIHIEGNINDSKWWDDDVTPKDIQRGLKEIGKVKKLDVYVNSRGGSCIAGNSIVDILDDYRDRNKCKINVKIRGIAASMGSGIATAGDTVSMASNALYMVHKPLTDITGNADDLGKAIEVLNKTEHTLVKNYMRKFKGTEEELRQLMAEETWLTAEEAKEYGFVDEITEGVKIVACAEGLQIDNCVFNNSIVDLINKKYPNAQITEKEEKNLNYDEKLKDYGIDEETFKSFNLESEAVLNVAQAVKVEAVAPAEPAAPVEQFVDKASVCDALGCEDITAEELINLAKVGSNPQETKVDETISAKADAYDKIVNEAREEALKNAVRAEGDTFNEEITKKMLNALDYDEIMVQNDAWVKKAEKELNAGERVSFANTEYVRESRPVNTNDYIIG